MNTLDGAIAQQIDYDEFGNIPPAEFEAQYDQSQQEAAKAVALT